MIGGRFVGPSERGRVMVRIDNFREIVLGLGSASLKLEGKTIIVAP
jgi:hypothetical protein